MFISTITSGLISTSSNVRYYWLEFVTYILPFYPYEIKSIIVPICNRLCDIIVSFENVYAFQFSQELGSVLDTLQKLITTCAIKGDSELTPASAAPGVIDSLNILGFLNRVEQAPISDPIVLRREEFFKALPTIFKAMIHVWAHPTKTDDEVANKFVLQDRIVKILDPVLREFPNEVIYGFVVVLEECRQEHQKHIPFVILDMFNAMDSVNPTVIFRTCSSILAGILKSKHRADNASKEGLLHETTVLEFVNTYQIKTISSEVDLAKAQNFVLQLIREGMISRSPNMYLQMLRFLKNYAEKIDKKHEDKRHRRELAEIIYSLVYNIARDASNNHTLEAKAGLDQKMQDRIRAVGLKSLRHLVDTVPGLYEVVSEDKDRAIVNILPIMLGFLRDRTEANLVWANVAVEFLVKLNEHDYNVNSYKKTVLTVFNEDTFFNTDFVGLHNWRKVINHIVNRDSSIFPDLVKIQKIPVFSNKDQFFARSMKRISFILFAGEMDQYAPFLQPIQEKILEALKLVHAPGVYEQVFLCLRVLILRISAKRFANFWPHILSEMMRIFGYGGKIAESPALILAVCKFLDIAILLPSDQFKLYEWIFILDSFEQSTVPGTTFVPFIEQLAYHASTESPIKLNVPVVNERQPLILMRTAESPPLEQLFSYLRHYSEASYTNLVTGGDTTVDIIESVIASDLIEFINVQAFEATPEKLVTERAKSTLKRQGQTLKLSSIIQVPNIYEDNLSDEDQIDADLNIKTVWPSLDDLRSKFQLSTPAYAEWLITNDTVLRVVSYAESDQLLSCETKDCDLVSVKEAPELQYFSSTNPPLRDSNPS